MAAVLERDPTLRAETARWKRLSVGTARGTDIGFGDRTSGPDLGRDRCGTAQAADSNQQERGRAVFPATRYHLQKKRVCERQSSIAPTWPIDETAVTTKMVRLWGRGPRGVELIGRAPCGKWE